MSSNFPQNSSRDIRTQVRCRSTRTAKRRYLRFRKRNHQQSRAMASCTLLFPLALLILPFSLLGARTRLLPSRLPALMMVSSHSSLLHPSSFPFSPQALGLFSHALESASTGFFYARCSFVTLDPWGASPFLFFPTLSPLFSIFSSSISCPRVSSYSFPPTPTIPAYASCVTSLSSSSPSSSRTMLCALSFLN